MSFLLRNFTFIKSAAGLPIFWICTILLLSALLRIPFLSSPESAVFDEGIYGSFALADIHQYPYLDIHPPLAKMLFAQFALSTTQTEARQELAERKYAFAGEEFRLFDYRGARSLVALFGVLLPIVIFLFARSIGFSPAMAGSVGVITTFDHALILYSRVALPDTIMMLFGIFGLSLILLSEQSAGWRKKFTLLVVGTIFIALSILIKWTALALLFIAGIIVLKRHISSFVSLFVLTILPLLIYIFVFLFYFSTFFPNGGEIRSIVPLQVAPDLSVPPVERRLSDKLTFLFRYHQNMFSSNFIPEVMKLDLHTLDKEYWPSGFTMLGLWASKEGTPERIILMGNPALWLLLFTSWVFYLFSIGMGRIKKSGERNAALLLSMAYVANYLPFFFIERPMFLYHYLPALLFLITLSPITVRYTFETVTTFFHVESYRTHIVFGYLLILLLSFMAIAILTYGL